MSLYKFTCGIVFENAKPYLTDAIVMLDESGTDTFRSQLGKYLGRRMTMSGRDSTHQKDQDAAVVREQPAPTRGLCRGRK